MPGSPTSRAASVGKASPASWPGGRSAGCWRPISIPTTSALPAGGASAAAPTWASRTEWLQARALALDVSEDFVAAGRCFDHRAGLDADQVEERAARGNLYRQRVTLRPPAYVRLAEGDEPAIAGGRWQVIVGRGQPRKCSACSAQSATF